MFSNYNYVRITFNINFTYCQRSVCIAHNRTAVVYKCLSVERIDQFAVPQACLMGLHQGHFIEFISVCTQVKWIIPLSIPRSQLASVTCYFHFQIVAGLENSYKTLHFDLQWPPAGEWGCWQLSVHRLATLYHIHHLPATATEEAVLYMTNCPFGMKPFRAHHCTYGSAKPPALHSEHHYLMFPVISTQCLEHMSIVPKYMCVKVHVCTCINVCCYMHAVWTHRGNHTHTPTHTQTHTHVSNIVL